MVSVCVPLQLLSPLRPLHSYKKLMDNNPETEPKTKSKPTQKSRDELF